MSDDEREDRDRLPKLREFDGNAEDYLDADEGYQRYARRHYKGGIDEWIYGGKCPIKDDLEEIEEICHQIVDSLMRTKPKYAEVLWNSEHFWTGGGADERLWTVTPRTS